MPAWFEVGGTSTLLLQWGILLESSCWIWAKIPLKLNLPGNIMILSFSQKKNKMSKSLLWYWPHLGHLNHESNSMIRAKLLPEWASFHIDTVSTACLMAQKVSNVRNVRFVKLFSQWSFWGVPPFNWQTIPHPGTSTVLTTHFFQGWVLKILFGRPNVWRS